ncbi:DUF3455 domain-containing protein [Collimonas sp. OK412]|jgi:outer membrane murein-binding lipoprotein Lpp|uniref:DUF3455 domain-containing protein n=1 Tax=Collimonas sp. (strain OK412) TaxID=1801619 RepID=UPI0008DF3071|nr:DUF3455 domain-containing protein [Collimonas sp. OK412]SFD12564.1 Protein of unknown function [Collimonas sp. OK412]
MTRKMLVTAATAWSALLLAGCASPPATTAIVVPDSLKVADTQALSLEAKATGVQIYQCAVAKADATQFEWRFVAPEADLFDNDGQKIGKHYAGPTWESTDGSKVVGVLQAHSDAPVAGAIPWLLLTAKSTDGIGVFGLTKSIQRLQTAGGNAPADGCDQAQLGKEARVPYTAIYRFYSAKS